MPTFEPADPDFAARMRESFRTQGVMALMGAELLRVEPGVVEMEFAYREDLTQHHGYLHAGVLTTIVDSACGYAAYSLMPVGSDVLTVEYKVNFLAPARGARFRAIGRVIKPGRTLTVCSGEVLALDGESTKTVAVMQATMMRLPTTN
ncbi:MAG: PaaI family thioesterase [Planctomycetaceae bacterium]